MKEACSARLVMPRDFAEYIGVLRMLASVACIFSIFAPSALAQVATRGGGDGLVARRLHSPPFSRRGGCATNKKIPFLSGADGVVSKRSRSLLINTRVAHLIFVGIY